MFFMRAISIVFFMLTLVFGSNLGGAKNGLLLSNKFSVQPSEFIKVPLAFFVAYFTIILQ